MRGQARLVGFLWRWHRRGGVLAAVFLLLIAGSGILLNHAAELGLDKRFVRAAWLRSYYGESTAALPAYPVGQRWVYRAASGLVYLDAEAVAGCRGELRGALLVEGLFLAACEEELLLIGTAGELVETFNAASGLPVPVSGVGESGSRAVIQFPGGWRFADFERIRFDAVLPPGSRILQSAPGTLPAEIRARIPEQSEWLNWERLLLDLHSGRVFGRFGVWVVDLLALVFCALALSGITMWWLRRRRRGSGHGVRREP